MSPTPLLNTQLISLSTTQKRNPRPLRNNDTDIQLRHSWKTQQRSSREPDVHRHPFPSPPKPPNHKLTFHSKTLQHSLSLVHTTTTNPTSLPNIPPELIQYVDNGRNPDIYTREFVELARKGNQLMKGKMEAWGGFRDVLAAEMGRCLPELEGDVKLVVEGTGGDVTKIEGLGGGVKGEE